MGLPGSGAAYEVDPANAQVVINKALSDAAAFGGPGGGVRLLAGTYTTRGPVIVGERQTLSGAGAPATNLVAATTGWSGDALVKAPLATRVTIEKLAVDGRNRVDHGVLVLQDVAPAVYGPDPMPRIRGVDVFQVTSDGFRLTGARAGACREFHVHDCRAQNCGGWGFNWTNSSDGFIWGCSVQGCKGGGFNVAGGNSKVFGCKAYGCGVDGTPAPAFRVSSGRATVTGCEAQDILGNGFEVSGTNSSVSGCNADSCGDGVNAANSAGFLITGSRVYVSGASYQRGNGGASWLKPGAGQMYAVRFAGGASSIIDLVGGPTIETYQGHISGNPGTGAIVRIV